MTELSRFRIAQIIFAIIFLISIVVLLVTRPFIGGGTVFVPTPTRLPARTPTPDAGSEDADSTAVPPPNSELFTYYTVRPGDTISSIAAQFQVPITDLEQANGRDVTQLTVHQVIAIPVRQAISDIALAATVETFRQEEQVRATAVAATVVALNQQVVAMDQRQATVEANVEANAVRIANLQASETPDGDNERVSWVTWLTGPLLTSFLALAGFATSTWFSYRDSLREDREAFSALERHKREAQLKLLLLQIREKEMALDKARRQDRASE